MKQILVILFFFLAAAAYSQDNTPCANCTYDYMTIVLKEGQYKDYAYISKSDSKEVEIRELKKDAPDSHNYSSILMIISEMSAQGWKVLNSNLAFDPSDKKLYFLLHKQKK